MTRIDTLPGLRLRTVARGAVTLGAVAVLSIALHVWRSLAENPASFGPDLQGWRKPFADGPAFDAPWLALAATVLVLMLPVADRYRRERRATAALVSIASAANMALAIGWLVIIRSEPDSPTMSPSDFYGGVRHVLPQWALSAVVLVLALLVLRWPALEPESTSDAFPSEFGEYLSE